MAVRITVQGEAGAPGVVQVLVEDERGAFLFDCGVAPGGGGLPPRIDGALISHAHPHHTAGIAHLPHDTHIYASVMTAAILKAKQDIATPEKASETVFAIPGGYTGSKVSRQAMQRPYTFLLTQNDSANPQGAPVDTFEDVHQWWDGSPGALGVGSITAIPASVVTQIAPSALGGRAVRHYPVDHSILGASAIAVETREGWVGYTGDIRFHGAQPGLMEEFAQGFQDMRPLALIVDGAHTEAGVAPVRESDVYERIKEAISGQDGLIVADFDAMDMERLLTFNAVAEMTRRQLILSLADAHMINAMGIVWRQFPALDEVDTIRILDVPSTDSGGMQWQLDVRSRYATILVSPEELRGNEGDYILRTSPSELGAVEAAGAASGVYIRSRAATGNEDGVLSRVHNAGLTIAGQDSGDANHFHSSGHATFDETVAMIRRIAPRHVIPVHSARPEAFAEALAGEPMSVTVPPRGQSIRVA